MINEEHSSNPLGQELEDRARGLRDLYERVGNFTREISTPGRPMATSAADSVVVALEALLGHSISNTVPPPAPMIVERPPLLLDGDDGPQLIHFAQMLARQPLDQRGDPTCPPGHITQLLTQLLGTLGGLTEAAWAYQEQCPNARIAYTPAVLWSGGQLGRSIFEILVAVQGLGGRRGG